MKKKFPKKNNQFQKYDRAFQKKFIIDYMKKSFLIENKLKTLFKYDLVNINNQLTKHILNKLYKKKFINKKNIDLSIIHKYVTEKALIEQKCNFDVTRNILTEVFFKKDNEFFKIYHLMLEEVKKKLKFPFLFQKDPFLRFNFPSKLKHDYLMPHVDLGLGHPPGEINIWLPVSKVNSSNSMSLSDLKKSNDFFSTFNYNFNKYIKCYNNKIKYDAKKIMRPYVSKAGIAIIFDGRVMHKTLLNNSENTRVSLDFRVLPLEFESIAKKYRGTGFLKQKFIRGGYYSKKFI